MRLLRRGGAGPWYAWGYDANGKRWQKSTRQIDRRAAERVAREWERRAADPRIAAAHETTVRVALEAFVASCAEEVAAGHMAKDTVDFYRRKCGHPLRLLGEDTPIAKLTAAELDRYVSARRREGASEHTLSKELTTLRQALALARRRGLFDGEPNVVVPKVAARYKPVERWLTTGETQKLLAQLQPHRAAAVAWMIAVGGDWSAVARARLEDVARDLSSCRVRGSKKATRDRTVPLQLQVQRDLLAFALDNALGENGLLFRPWATVNRDLKLACAKARIERCSPNDFRRTIGHWLRSAGVEPHLISLALGHKTSTMAEVVYARPNPEALASLIEAQVRRHAPEYLPKTTADLCSNSAAAASDFADTTDRTDAPGETKTPQEHCGESVSTGCRRSDLNQRPWDYDSPALTS